jgi:HlyD family secretion protein
MNVTLPPDIGIRPGAPPSPHPAAPPAPRHHMLLLWGTLLVIVIVAAVLIEIRVRAGGSPQYQTVAVARGNLVQTVTAEGTVNPQNLILVGTQVSGTISELDVDYNSVVRTGQVMAKIDPSLFADALGQAQASHTQFQRQYTAGVAAAQSATQNVAAARQNAAAAQAALASAAAQVAKAKASLDLAQVTLRRDKTLLTSGYIAQNQYDTDSANAVAATAAYTAAKLAVNQAEAQLQAQNAVTAANSAQARSTTATAHADQAAIGVYAAQAAAASYNLKQSVIVSPVNGTVIARNVTVGQTVAASFSTPTLFTIAQDLSKMEVDVAVGEPDIGGIHAGAVTDFTVLAYPNRTFHGTVYQVRQNPTTVNNVVTYDTVVYVENTDGALYPGMTANASVHVTKVNDALLIPLQALQWSAPGSGGRASATGESASPWGTTSASLSRTIVAGRNGRVFVLRAGKLTYVSVRILLVNGTEAAIAPISTPLAANDRVVIATQAPQSRQTAAPSSALTRTTTNTLAHPAGAH